MPQKVSKLFLGDTFKSYKKKYTKPVEKKDYLTINYLYNKFLLGKVFQGEVVTLPSNLGDLSVVGKKRKITFDEDGNIRGVGVDWVKTKALRERSETARLERKRVFYTNSHSDGYVYKFLWAKKGYLIENKILYSLKLTRTNIRTLSKLIFSGREFTTYNN
jgi:hypothetical protein